MPYAGICYGGFGHCDLHGLLCQVAVGESSAPWPLRYIMCVFDSRRNEICKMLPRMLPRGGKTLKNSRKCL